MASVFGILILELLTEMCHTQNIERIGFKQLKVYTNCRANRKKKNHRISGIKTGKVLIYHSIVPGNLGLFMTKKSYYTVK